MTTRALLLSSLLAVPLVACATATTAGNVADDAAAIRAANERFERSVAARDTAAIVALYEPNATVNPPNAPAATGTAAIRSLWAEFLRMPDLDLAVTPGRVELSAGGDMALDAGTYRLKSAGPNGPFSDEGKYAVTWRKTAGEWKIASETWNSSLPLPEPAPAVAAAPAPAAAPDDASEMETPPTGGLKWGPLEIPGFKPGIQIAAIHGDPTKEGDYTLRLRFPSGYNFPSHWHPNGEHVTVIRGTFRLGMGEKEDPAALKSYAPGAFLYIPAKMRHYGGAQGVTEVQLHGTGPFQVFLASQP